MSVHACQQSVSLKKQVFSNIVIVILSLLFVWFFKYAVIQQVSCNAYKVLLIFFPWNTVLRTLKSSDFLQLCWEDPW